MYLLREVALVCVLCFTSSLARAAAVTWTGVGGDWNTPSNWSGGVVPAADDDVTIDVNAVVSALFPAIKFKSLTLGGTGTPTLKLSTGTASAGALVIKNGAALEQNSALQLLFSSVVVEPGGKITHTANGSIRSYVLNLNILGNLELQSGATIYMDWAGYKGGGGAASGPGAPPAGYPNGSGGGHGGAGGGSLYIEFPSVVLAPGGTTYDDIANPVELGSGGSNGSGGAEIQGGSGGGALIARIGGVARLNGLVTADGKNGTKTLTSGGGGGSGGTINITAGTIEGAGMLSARGGPSIGNAGGGGGGRIALYYSYLGPAIVTRAQGGTGYQAGGNGTIYTLNNDFPYVSSVTLSGPAIAGSAPGKVHAGELYFTVVFDKGMDITEPPSVSFGPSAPYNQNIVTGVWQSTAVWTGAFSVTGQTANGPQKISVSDAMGANGKPLATDTSRSFAIDTVNPSSTTLAAIAKAAGKIEINFQRPEPSTEAGFILQRSQDPAFSTFTVIADEFANGTAALPFTEGPLADGTYFYRVFFRDMAGNTGAFSEVVFAVADSLPPASPQPLGSLSGISAKSVDVSWAPVEAASYNVYRATYPAANISALAPLIAGTTAALIKDSPVQDSTYYYFVTAVDAAGNESAISGGTAVVFDIHAPVISIAGISQGQHANYDVSPLVAVTDFSPYSSTITVNGQSFSNGTVLSQPGTYYLEASAADVFGSSSSVSLSFTIDKSSPSLSIVFPADGLKTRSDVTAVYTSSDDFTAAGSLVIKDAQNNLPPFKFTTEGLKTLAITSRDLAGNISSAAVSFTLDKTGPSRVTDLSISSVSEGSAFLSWHSPSDNLTGVSSYSIRYSTFGITDSNFNSAYVLTGIPVPASAGSQETFVVPVSSTRTYYFALRSEDGIGNLSQVSNSVFFDSEGPALSQLSPAPGATVSRPAVVSVQASDISGIAWAAFYIDGVFVATRTFSPYSFNWNTLNYADGSHVVSVAARDNYGNVSETSAVYTLRYSPPSAPVITSPADNYATTSSTISVEGTAEPGVTVQVKVNGFPAASATALSAGTYRVVVTLPAEGENTITALASDSKGTGSPCQPVTVSYNITPPGAPVNFMAAALPAGKIRLAWTAPSGKVPSSYGIYRSPVETNLSSGTVPSSGFKIAETTGTSFTDLPSSSGLYYYGATSKDKSGNESGLSSVQASVSDRVQPSAAVEISGPAPYGPGSRAIRLTLSKQLASPPLLLFTPGGQGPFPVALSPSSVMVWEGTFTVTSSMNSGTGTFGFEGTDLVGNTGRTITSGGSALLDTNGPMGTVSINPASPVKAGPVSVTLTLNEDAAAVPSLYLMTAVGSSVPVTLEGSLRNWSGSDGPAAFYFSAYDISGNTGTFLLSGGNLTIDTVPPGSPISLKTPSGPGGKINLSWSSPIDGVPSYYSVYRDGVVLPQRVTPSPDGTGSYSETLADGSYVYTVTAVDSAGNEGPFSNSAAGKADSIAPSSPVGLTAGFNEFGRLVLDWTVSTEAVKYNLYRSTWPFPIAAGVLPLTVTPPYVDTPARNGTYYYLLTGLDPAGNESLPSNRAEIFWSSAAPVITIEGAVEGGLYNSDLTLSYSAQDPALASLQGLLDGLPFSPGGAVSSEGAHELSVTAANFSGISSTKTLHFILDKTLPAVTVTGIAQGILYNAAVIPDVTVTDARLKSVALTLDGSPYVSGVPIQSDGSHTFTVRAEDFAGNIRVVNISFTMDLPPSAPSGFSFSAEEGLGASLSWQKPSSDVIGYKLYKDGILKNQGLLSELRLSDPDFALGSSHLYEVSAVDQSGQEGPRSAITVPAATFELASCGSPSESVAQSPGGQVARTLTRGFFDYADFTLSNGGGQPVLLGPVSIELKSSGVTVFTGQAPSASVPAAASRQTSGVISVPANLPDASVLRAVMRVPSQPGTTASLARVFTLSARSPREPIVELFPEPLVRGTERKAQVKFNNQGSAPVEIRTAPNGGLSISLATPEGTVLSQARLNQTDNGAQPAPSAYFVSIAPGSSFMFNPVPIFVPSALGDTARLSAVISGVYNGLVSPQPLSGTRSFEAVKILSGVESPAYSVSVAPDRRVYDQGSAVILSGSASDPLGNLVPGATVQVGISVRGFERTASTFTDSGGNYSIVFNPSPQESGLYTLWASHPDVISRVPQSSFTITGFGFQYSDYSVSLVQNSSVRFTVNLNNTGQSRVEGLTARIISTAPVSGISLSFDSAVASSLEAGQSAALSFTASASADAGLGRYVFTAEVKDSNGFTRLFPVYVNTGPSAPSPAVSPQAFSLGINSGQSRVINITLKNNGYRDWEGVSVSSPAASWARLQGASGIGNIPPGGSASFSIVIEPPSGLATRDYAFNPLVEARSDNSAAVPVNALITVTASDKGNAVYNIINADVARVAGAGQPVAGAEASLVSLDVAGLSLRSLADSNGVARFVDVPAGRYNRTVRASGFSDSAGVETIEPGVTKTSEILLPTDVVTYEWTVVPTTIQDQYQITLGMTFKTNVPVPAVTVSPAVINLAMEGGQSADAQITLKNEGLVSAFNVTVSPDVSDSAVTVDIPYTVIPELKAGQSVVVPFHVSLAHASCHAFGLKTDYESVCAAGAKITKSVPSIRITAGDCFGLPSVSVGGGGGSGFGGSTGSSGSGSSGVSLSVPASYISYAIQNPPSVPAAPKSCKAPKDKEPSRCARGICEGGFSDAGGDPRIPESDLSVNVPNFGGSLDFVRVYDSQDYSPGVLGPAWFHSFESRVTMRLAASVFIPAGGMSAGIGVPETIAEFRPPDGRRLIYKLQADGTFKAPAGETSVLVVSGSTSAPTGFTWTLPDKTVYGYDGTGKLVSITDRNGNIVSLEYNASGRVQTVKDPGNRTLYTFAYNGDGKLATVTDLAGRTVDFSYQSGMLSGAVNPKGSAGYGYTSYAVPGLQDFGGGLFDGVDTVTLLTQVASPNGQVTGFTYGPAAQVTDYAQAALNPGAAALPLKAGILTPADNKTYYAPLLADGTGYAVDAQTFARWYFPQRFLTLSESGPLGTFTFSHKIDELLEEGTTEVTDPRGFKRVHKWETVSGKTIGLALTDAAGGVASTTYDIHNNPVRISGPGTSVSFVFNSQNLPTSVENAAGSKAFISYDPAFGMVNSISDGRGNRVDFSFDSNGNTTRVSQPGSEVGIVYDAHGLPVTITDAVGHSIQIGRDNLGNANSFTDALSRTTHLEYDSLGRLAAAVDARSSRVEYQYDNADYLTKNITPGFGETTLNYSPGPLGTPKLLTSVTDARNQTTRFTYDSRGRPVTAANPLDQSRSYTYDEEGNLTSETNARSQAISYTYDNIGRLKTEVLPEGTITYDYDAAGNLISIEDAGSKIQIAYDNVGRPVSVQETYKAGNLTTSISYAYDAADNRISMSLAGSPQPFNYTYAYDSLNRLSSLTDPQNRIYSFTYDAAGRRTKLSYPNGVDSNYVYDAANQLTRIEHRQGQAGPVLAFADYNYNEVGDRSGMTDHAGEHTYGYDSLRRLIEARHPAISTVPVKVETFAYDSVGNRTSDAVRTGQTYDAANRLLSDSQFNYAYDADGNITVITEAASGAQAKLFYNTRGRLIRVEKSDNTVVLFTHDVLGRRIEKSVLVGTATVVSRYVYDNNDVIAVLDGDNIPITIYTHGPGEDEPLAVRNMSGQDYYIHSDGLNSVMAHTGATGALVERIDYQSFGQPLYSDLSNQTVSTQSLTGSPYAFSSREFDNETGFYFFPARYLDPQSGRFISEDPIGFNGGMNFYAYSGNNPYSLKDPSGEYLVPVLLGAWAAYEVLASIYDLYSLIDTLTDPCAGPEEKALMSGLFIAGLVQPGGGYTGAAKSMAPKLKMAFKHGFPGPTESHVNNVLSGGLHLR